MQNQSALSTILNDRKYLGIAWIFASLNLLIGTWAIYIPTIKNKLQLDESSLGIALFCYALGHLIFMPFVPMVSKRFGLANTSFYGMIISAFLFTIPFMANSYLMLCLGLFLTGLVSSNVDISINALVSNFEEEDEVKIMIASHGFFSLGGVLSAGIGSWLISIINNPIIHIFSIAILVLVTNVYLFQFYKKTKDPIDDKTNNKEKIAFKWSYLLVLAPLIVIIMFTMGIEGAMVDWSKLFMLDVVSTNSIWAGYAYMLFSLTMTLGRFWGDSLGEKLGSKNLLIIGLALGFTGISCILISQIYVSLLGFFLLGLGFSALIPEIFRLAGQSKEIPTTIGISIVAGFGYSGFLLAPVLLGFIAHQWSLWLSFLCMLVAVVFCLVASLQLKRD